MKSGCLFGKKGKEMLKKQQPLSIVSDILQFDLGLIKVFTVIKDHNANLLLYSFLPKSFVL